MTTVQEITTTTNDTIREKHLKYIAEISGAASLPKFEKLTQDQQDFLDRKGRYASHIQPHLKDKRTQKNGKN